MAEESDGEGRSGEGERSGWERPEEEGEGSREGGGEAGRSGVSSEKKGTSWSESSSTRMLLWPEMRKSFSASSRLRRMCRSFQAFQPSSRCSRRIFLRSDRRRDWRSRVCKIWAGVRELQWRRGRDRWGRAEGTTGRNGLQRKQKNEQEDEAADAEVAGCFLATVERELDDALRFEAVDLEEEDDDVDDDDEDDDDDEKEVELELLLDGG